MPLTFFVKMNSMQVQEVMGFDVFNDHLGKIPMVEKGRVLVNTISPNSYGISTKDLDFRRALQHSDVLVLDGVYFALGSIFLKGKNIQKNQGPDVFYYFMKRINEQKGSAFFLGASNETLKKINDKANVEFPGIRIGTYSPPYKPEFTAEDNHNMIEAVNDFEPDILFIGMTCPKQEKWSFENKEHLNAKVICSIGAVFDWYAGNQKTISPIWWKLRLAWLIRTIHRPEILKRYPMVFLYFWHLFLAILGFKKYRYGKF